MILQELTLRGGKWSAGDSQEKTLKLRSPLKLPPLDLDDDTEVMWGIFTRFDPGSDMFFTNQKFNGATPIYEGTVGIDATWKGGYEKTLTMDDKIVHKVEEKWDQYWK